MSITAELIAYEIVTMTPVTKLHFACLDEYIVILAQSVSRFECYSLHVFVATRFEFLCTLQLMSLLLR